MNCFGKSAAIVLAICDDDSYMNCKHCPAQVKANEYHVHLEREHKCLHCGNYMPKESLPGHLKRIHECQYCGAYMRKESLEGHILKNHSEKCKYCSKMILDALMPVHLCIHFAACKYCNQNILVSNMGKHLAKVHPLQETLGIIRLDKISDDEFNELIDKKLIYAKSGHLFRK